MNGLPCIGQVVLVDDAANQALFNQDFEALQHGATLPTADPGELGRFYGAPYSGDVSDSDRLYFRQLLSGRDFAAGDAIAAQMRNFAYLIGDRETGDCVVVDPAYAAGDLLDTLKDDGMQLSGVLVTHHHPDHIGGSM